MSKENKQNQKELEKQAQVNELLAKINAQRAAGELSSEPKEKNENIRAAKEKLNEAYKGMAEMENRRKELEKRNDPATHTYSEEEKARILQQAKDATSRYMKLKEFTESFELLKQRHEREETMKQFREQEQKARAEAAAKKNEE